MIHVEPVTCGVEEHHGSRFCLRSFEITMSFGCCLLLGMLVGGSFFLLLVVWDAGGWEFCLLLVAWAGGCVGIVKGIIGVAVVVAV